MNIDARFLKQIQVIQDELRVKLRTTALSPIQINDRLKESWQEHYKRFCHVCGEILPARSAEYFAKESRSLDGLSKACSKCKFKKTSTSKKDKTLVNGLRKIRAIMDSLTVEGIDVSELRKPIDELWKEQTSADL